MPRSRDGRSPRRRRAGWARSLPGSQFTLDPEPDIDEARVVVAPGDQLDADRQPIRPRASRQRQAWHMKHGPQAVEDRIAGRGEPLWRLAGGGEGEDRVEPASPLM